MSSSPFGLTCALGVELDVLRFQWKETLGECHGGYVDVLVDEVANTELLKTPVALRIDATNGDANWMHGIATRVENLGPVGRQTQLRIHAEACIALLRFSADCRIFQNMSSPEIIQAVFEEHGYSGQLELRLSSNYESREYCVQFGETDLNFVSRLMQEDGIYYFIEHSVDQHVVVLADGIGAHAEPSGGGELSYRDQGQSRLDEYLWDIHSCDSFGTGAVWLGDYDFTKPNVSLGAVQRSAEADTSWEQAIYPAGHTDLDEGQRLARIHLESIESRKSWIHASGNSRSLRCGNLLTVKEHATDEINADYLVTSCSMEGSQSFRESRSDSATDFSFECQYEVLRKEIPFRNTRTAQRPAIHGPQLATVVGKEGEEIWTDRYGRVKVQFPWDRKGASDDQSSCWIRVVQNWTGKSWGAMSIPRIGEEVIVEFLDGNPDRPVVVGRLYNENQLPPEELATSQAKTVWRTHSTKEGDQSNFNELSFDDTKDQELVYLHSERDFKRVVENNDLLEVGFDKSDAGDQEIKIYNDQKTTIGSGSGSGSQTVEIKKDREVTIEDGNDTLTVKSGDLTIDASSGAIKISASTSITLTCGSSTISIEPSQISISSSQISVEAEAELGLQGTNSSLEASGQLDMKGALASLNASGPLTVKGAVVQVN